MAAWYASDGRSRAHACADGMLHTPKQRRFSCRFDLLPQSRLPLLLMSPSSGKTQVLMERNVSLHMALTIAETALAQCGVRTSVAVVDRAGRPPCFPPGRWGVNRTHLELARRKAYTALTFQRTSAEWATRTETTLSGQRMLADVIPLAGGVPIKVGEDTIGGVGLSGAPMGGAQEEACAKAGIAKVADQLR